MYELIGSSLNLVSGGTEPTCTTRRDQHGNEATVCICPEGTEPATGTSGQKTVIRCIPKSEA